jgi:hypothetical protein
VVRAALQGLPFLPRTALLTGLIVMTMTWVVMPRLTKLMRGFLNPHARSSAAGSGPDGPSAALRMARFHCGIKGKIKLIRPDRCKTVPAGPLAAPYSGARNLDGSSRWNWRWCRHRPSWQGSVPGNRGIWVGILCELSEFALMFLAYAWFKYTHPEDFHRGPAMLYTACGVANTVTMLTSGYFAVRALLAIRATTGAAPATG